MSFHYRSIKARTAPRQIPHEFSVAEPSRALPGFGMKRAVNATGMLNLISGL
jgi:hypothetical protein